MTVNWSSRMANFTFGYCLVNSSASAFANGNPVSAYISSVIGALASSVLTALSVCGDDESSEPGALQAPATSATAASGVASTMPRRGHRSAMNPGIYGSSLHHGSRGQVARGGPPRRRSASQLVAKLI
jgi:hypothetical protein